MDVIDNSGRNLPPPGSETQPALRTGRPRRTAFSSLRTPRARSRTWFGWTEPIN